LVLILLATGGWLLITATTFYSNLRLMGYDERAAYTAGIRIFLVRIGAHILSGLFAGLSAISYTALIGSGDPTRGSTLTLTAITALVLGGAALSGGRSSVVGALLGAITLYLIGYVLSTLNFGDIQSFVTELAYGLILVLALLLTLLIPTVQRHLSFISPYGMFIVLGLVVLGLMLQVAVQPGHAGTATVANASATALSTKGHLLHHYFLLPRVANGGPRAAHAGGTGFSPIQEIAFIAIAMLGFIVLTLRISVAEASARRRGAFLYVVMGVLIVVVFLAFTGISTHKGASMKAARTVPAKTVPAEPVSAKSIPAKQAVPAQ
jgi:ribose transport system permease protein